ncbi:DUF3108 domain-containing protein [Labilibacter marinus]|uniref:DUF3108 domain-containing protein n=1 Tax=Labilibacter marinus TaxID=1477105 RepID=UPI00082CDDC0|nr:DUF3108 domain-containing protein [Labilibacter marinus]
MSIIYKTFFAVLLLYIGIQSINAQCNIENSTFRSGEVVTYHAYYNWHFIWINAGIVHFSVKEAQYEESDAWFLSAYGRTYSGYDKFMKVRDTFEVYVDKDRFEPLHFNRVTKEGSTVGHHQYWFNYKDSLVQTKTKKGEVGLYKDSVITLKDCTSDLLTMVYKARNIDYSKYQVNEKIPIRMIVDNKIHDLYIRYLGKEIIKNRDGRSFKCLKFSPLLVAGTIFESGEDMTVWVTNDEARVPIVVEAKVLVGSVKAVFVDAVGLLNPITAEVKE